MNRKNTYLLLLWIILSPFGLFAQEYTRQDTLRGSITPERAWWDLVFYDLDIQVDPERRTIGGKNTIYYTVLEPRQVIQIDLQEPMQAQSFLQDGKKLTYRREGNVYFVRLDRKQQVGELNSIEVTYGGQPKTSTNPPWDGGITWSTDSKGNPFIANSNQGDGASLWWPCKDHMYDEPDSMQISVRVPKPLMNISNGRLRNTIEHADNTRTFQWYVDNPINNYGVNISIGDYAYFGEIYLGEKGPLTLDYYVLKENLETAKVHFRDAPKMMRAFEYWFGPYPFYEDGFKLIEVPYLGMEHQSAVTYGNKYQKGYLGSDFSKTGWGLTFDYIIIHEAGHEWFANNITYKDIADMWIHESFTTYSEGLFIDYHYGKQAGSDYIVGARQVIRNDKPIIGVYNLNQRGSGDMYFKGANILHTLRTWINDDEKWRQILRRMNREFYHTTTTTQEVEQFLTRQTGLPLGPFFDQYLRTADIPTLEWKEENGKFAYRWSQTVANFYMPVGITQNGETHVLHVLNTWQQTGQLDPREPFEIDRNVYIFEEKGN
ncbi:Peptidase M1 family protein [Lunatimonas lonarensis]|uniref:Peptidase M1 family protein n=1 Tax=Lunatimonas lonarensis TaxID=1232681 RepID=R7ZZ46_9BACT|nr:M1 family metallopeptidase [Lunatimonas lonarensis]EON79372.1 Peptidase M1 family protein [Lunatimonas lonarensis]